MRQQLQPAYVIHTRAFRDTSMIVELFTPEHGRVSVLARGVKTGKAKKSLLLQPFRSLHVSWAGRGELPVLSAVEEAGNTLHLQGQSLACGYYVNELIYHLLPRDDPAQGLFANYWSVVSSLDDLSRRDAALRRFELELLVQIGYEPLLDHDYASGEMIAQDGVYRYRVPEGPYAVVGNADDSIDACHRSDSADAAVDNVKASHANSSTHLQKSSVPQGSQQGSQQGLLVRGKTLLDLATGCFENPVTLREARDLMRLLIHYQLDGRELLSRSLFNSYSKLEKSQQTTEAGSRSGDGSR